MLASLVAFLMHPLLWTQMNIGSPFDWSFMWIAGLYLFVYGITGVFVRMKCVHFSWKRQALISFFIINVILATALYINLSWPVFIEYDGIKEQRHIVDGLTILIVLITSSIAALLSVIPIGICCYFFRKEKAFITRVSPCEAISKDFYFQKFRH